MAETLAKKYVVAPMVDMSELAFRLLCRRYGAQLCYSPMIHAGNFIKEETYREKVFTTCESDRPLIVQFCANDPDVFVEAAKLIQDKCDGIDLNLGCPQIIARRGYYGSFLQDDWPLIESIVKKASTELNVPITCKIRILDTEEKTVEYAKMLQNAGCKMLAVHGRTRDQKGHATGLADWNVIRKVKENLTIPVLANGNILSHEDIERCLAETGVDGVMSAEGILHNPALFSDKTVKVCDMAEVFLQLCHLYPCDVCHIRTHLFRILAYCLPHFKDLQEELAQANTIEKLKLCVEELSLRLSESPSEEVSNQSLPPSGSDAIQSEPPSGDITDKSEPPCGNDTNQSEPPSDDIINQSGTPRGSDITQLEPPSEDITDKSEPPSENNTNQSTDEDYKKYWLPIDVCHARPRVKVDRHGIPLSRSALPVDKTVTSEERLHLRNERKQRKYELKLAAQRSQRQTKRQQKRERDRILREEQKKQTESDDVDESDRLSRRDRKLAIRERLQKALVDGQRVCVDLGMEAIMSNKECSRLAQQLCRLYGTHKKSSNPLHVYFTGLAKSGFLYKECVRKIDGFDNFLVDMTEKSHTEIFKPEEIVQLTPDSPNVLTTLYPDKVYVIGGLVDETVNKHVTLSKAEKLSIETARLPIDEYMERKDTGTFSKILAVNQVFDILVEYNDTADWTKALPKGIPSRKGFVIKEELNTS